MQITTNSAKETEGLGKKLAKYLNGKDVVCLFGELGSGKTTFVKGLAVGLGVKKIEVSSPSFILMRKYKGRLPLYHFDLYRIKDFSEICDIGYEEFIFGDGIAAIEWADRMRPVFPKGYLKVRFLFLGQDKRLIKFSGSNQRYRGLIRKI